MERWSELTTGTADFESGFATGSEKFRMSLDRELIDRLLVESERPEDIIGENGPLKQLTKPLVKRVLAAELTAHLGYEMHAAEGRLAGCSRNGAGSKRLKRRHG
jgi:hypothetical protein